MLPTLQLENKASRNRNMIIQDTQNREKVMELERKKLIDRINEYKTERKEILMVMSNLQNEIDQIKLEMKILKDYDEIMNTQSKIKKYFDDQKLQKKGTKKTYISNENEQQFNENQLLSEYRKAAWIREDKYKMKKKECEIKEERRENLKVKLDQLNSEILQNQEELSKLTNFLLTHYHKLLNQGIDTRKEGIVWIIRSIWNLGFSVIVSHFPSYLDEKSIKFLFKYAHKLLEIDKIEKEVETNKLYIKQFYQSKLQEEVCRKSVFTTEEEENHYNPFKSSTAKIINKIKENIQLENEKMSFRKIKEIADNEKGIDDQSKLYIQILEELESQLNTKKEGNCPIAEKRIGKTK